MQKSGRQERGRAVLVAGGWQGFFCCKLCASAASILFASSLQVPTAQESLRGQASPCSTCSKTAEPFPGGHCVNLLRHRQRVPALHCERGQPRREIFSHTNREAVSLTPERTQLQAARVVCGCLHRCTETETQDGFSTKCEIDMPGGRLDLSETEVT